MRSAESIDSFNMDESGSRVSLFPDMRVLKIGLDFEKQAHSEGYRFVAGVDEVGRGCLAGPVVAAACILDISKPLPDGLNDSKKLTAAKRDEIARELRENAICFAVGQIEADEIDRINILQATFKAMSIAVGGLTPASDFLLIDAVKLRQIDVPQRSIIKGDSISASIAAASILAKTYRDELMREADGEYPHYGFAKHVGYGTQRHFDALRTHGPCALHRRSFRGVLQEDRA